MKHWLKDQWAACVAIGFLGFLGIIWVASPEMVRMTGETMGVPYQISVEMPRWRSGERLHLELKEVIHKVELTVDDTDPLSGISRLNADSSGSESAVDASLLRWLFVAEKLVAETGGAYDPTMGAIADLWGIGTPKAMVPVPGQVAAIRKVSGWAHIRLAPGRVCRNVNGVTVSLSGIRDGILADTIASELRVRGYQRFFVEVGDAAVAGTPRKGTAAWQVGVGIPAVGATPERLIGLVGISGGAMATTVKDRRSFTVGNSRYSSVIDGRTMQPVTNSVASVTVIAENAALAQGLSVALTCLGPNDGKRLMDRYPHVRAMWVVTTHPGGDRAISVNGFDRMFGLAPGARVTTENWR